MEREKTENVCSLNGHDTSVHIHGLTVLEGKQEKACINKPGQMVNQ